MPIFHTREEYEAWLTSELPQIAQRMRDDPSRGISQEEMEQLIAQWDAEDDESEALRQSA